MGHVSKCNFIYFYIDSLVSLAGKDLADLQYSYLSLHYFCDVPQHLSQELKTVGMEYGKHLLGSTLHLLK